LGIGKGTSGKHTFAIVANVVSYIEPMLLNRAYGDAIA